MSKRILLLSPFFFPEPISTGKYNTCIAKELVNAGNTVDVISSHPLYPEWMPKPTYATLPGIEIYRGGQSIKYPRSQYFRRLYLEIWYTIFSIFIILKNRRYYDIVIPVLPPSLFLLFISKLLNRKTEIRGIIHDLQGIYAGRSSSFIIKILYKIIFYAEKESFKQCNKLIFLSYEMESYVKNKYNINNVSTTVHYPFYNVDKYVEEENVITERQVNESGLSKIFQDQSCFHIVYSGALGIKQNPIGLINFLQSISKHYSDVVCHIFSAGPIFEHYLNIAQSNEKNKIQFHPLVAEVHIAELYHFSSCQIIPQESGTSSGSLPSKLPNIVNCGVPVFCICDEDSEIASIINGNSLGIVSHTWDINTLQSIFQSFKDSYLENADPNFENRTNELSKKLFDISNTIQALTQ